MGGGSALLINSNRRGSGGSEFGCTGWFCDVLDGTMLLLVVMIIATAVISCFKKCFPGKHMHSNHLPKITSEVSTDENGENETQLPPPPPLPVMIVMESPPDYSERERNAELPPAYCTLRFDQQNQGVQI